MARTDVETLVLRLEANMRGYERSMNRAAANSQRTAQRIERHFESLESRLSTRFRRIGRAGVAAFGAIGAAVGGAMVGRQLISVADTWTELSNQVLSAEASLGRGIASLEQLAEVATSTRSDLNATVRLYTRTERAVADLGLTTNQTLRFTELLNRAFVAGGQSAQEQRSAILQLSQALASGQLMGEELRAIRENAPLVARAIADSMGVSIGALRDLGSEGRITADVVVRAMLEAGEEIDRQFEATQMTVSQAMTNLSTAFSQAVGESNEAAGGTNALAEAIDQVATTITENKEGLAEFVEMLGDMASGSVEAASGIGGLYNRITKFLALRFGIGADEADLRQSRVNQLNQWRELAANPNFARRSADEQLRLLDQIASLEKTIRDSDDELREQLSRGPREAIEELLNRGSATGGGGAVPIPPRPADTEFTDFLDQLSLTLDVGREEAEQDFTDFLDDMEESVKQAGYEAAVAQADAYKEQLETRRSEFARTFGNVFADGVRAAFEGDLQQFLVRRLQNAFYSAIANAMEQVGSALFNRLTGGGSKGGGLLDIFLGGIGGGGKRPKGRAIGGPVRAGQAYTVGEHGVPEVFIPDQSGKIVPGLATGRGGANMTYAPQFSIDARGATPDAVNMLNRKIDAIRAEDQRLFAGRVRAVLPGVMDEVRRDGVM